MPRVFGLVALAWVLSCELGPAATPDAAESPSRAASNPQLADANTQPAVEHNDNVANAVEQGDGASPPADDPTVAAVLATSGDDSTSRGSSIEGSLDGGVALPARGPGFRHNPTKSPDRRYGTAELVGAIVRAAAEVDATLPGGEVTINDISAQSGGDIPGHATHRSGRDVDVLFYLLDPSGQPRPGHAVPLEPDGTGVDYRDLASVDDDVAVRIDAARTWRFVQALITDEFATIQQIYIVEHLRRLLMDHATASKVPKWIIGRFANITCQPKFPHDDHMHIRFFCSAQDIASGCLDDRPIYPWHRNALAEAGVRAKIAGPRTTARPKLTSIEQARADAGPMHADVVAFLERRKAWAKKPHPKRPYCR